MVGEVGKGQGEGLLHRVDAHGGGVQLGCIHAVCDFYARNLCAAIDLLGSEECA